MNPELYEVAKIDGANKFRQIWHISIPSISPTIIMLFILGIGSLVSGSFEQILATTNASLFEVSEIIPLYVYHKGIVNFQVSVATAAGLFQSVFSFILVYTCNYVARRVGDTSIW